MFAILGSIKAMEWPFQSHDAKPIELLWEEFNRELESLIRQEESNSVDPRKTVINLFRKKLDDNAIEILNKGMKIVIAPTQVDTLDMILAVEMAAGKIQPPEAADEYRWKVRTAIEKAKPKQIRQNISKAEQRSLKELMKNDGNSPNNNSSW
ncbi:hypothetical protein Trydic_g16608 [Trypoxylus dichotomus]